jgi:molybdenum cofactor cytidylyltransferase
VSHVAVFDALVLAAGTSSRLGRLKQLLPYGETTLLGHAIATARAAGVRRVGVVVGAHAADVAAEAMRARADLVAENADWAVGMGSSLRVGTRALTEHALPPDALLVLLCDQPLVTASDLRRLLAHGHDVVVASVYDGATGVPALFPRRMFGALAALEGAAGAKALLRGSDVARVECPAAAVDIDTEADWSRLAAQAQIDS